MAQKPPETIAMPKLTVQVRTDNNLLDVLAAGESVAWKIAVEKEQQITHVRIVNFAGTQAIEGVFDRNASSRRDDGRLILRFLDGRIVDCQIEFDGQNPVRYLDEETAMPDDEPDYPNPPYRKGPGELTQAEADSLPADDPRRRFFDYSPPTFVSQPGPNSVPAGELRRPPQS